MVAGTRSPQVAAILACYDVAVGHSERALDRLRGVERTRRQQTPALDVVLARLVALVALGNWGAVAKLMPVGGRGTSRR
ncbi:MAG: hypothetical protein M3R49_08520 [Chloroflexota bacterium]|nr:hypothetical protein [Chloroflexota bacterium]